MNKEQEKLAATAAKLRDQLATAQAAVDAIRAKLSRVEAKLSGEPPQETGLDMLWKAAPPMARTRSSKFKCRAAYLRIPAAQRPRVSDMLAALKAWSRCQEWKKDEGQFVPALDRWIRDRRWEDLPEDVQADPLARYRAPRKPAPQLPPEELASAEDIAAICQSDWLKKIPQTASTPQTETEQ